MLCVITGVVDLLERGLQWQSVPATTVYIATLMHNDIRENHEFAANNILKGREATLPAHFFRSTYLLPTSQVLDILPKPVDAL